MPFPLLHVKNLKVSFFHKEQKLQVVRGFDLQLNKGEIVGILGESGSGKTVSASSIIKLYEQHEGMIDEGEIFFDLTDIRQANEKAMNKIRGRQIAYIFQNPAASLNPYKSIGKQLTNMLRNHRLPNSYSRIIQGLKEVGIDEPEQVYTMYPHQLSGGQNQRIMIAGAILCEPNILIADEPTSSIDASLSKKILDLLKELNQKYAMSILLITHDFDVAKYLCDRLIIMYGGLIMEEGTISEIFENPLHPYTAELLKCVLSLDNKNESIYSLDGSPIAPKDFKDECPFYQRCKESTPICQTMLPTMCVMDKRQVRCTKYIQEVT